MAVFTRIPVRLTPRATRDAIEGWQEDILRVRVSAPPVDGRANEALLRLLSRALSLPKSRMRIVQGEHARQKLVQVEGLSQPETDERLGRYEGYSEKSAC